MVVESQVMRTLCIALALCCFACTKRNEALCCNDEADCVAKDIPIGSKCDEGLICRGNQCIAILCGSSAECDASAPYCVATSCAEQCTEDVQCPGATQDPTQTFCVSGTCEVCRTSDDCPMSAPFCDAGTCRACSAHAECASGVCEQGLCVSQTLIAYASPSGSTTSACTQDMPCTFERALGVVDASRNVVKLSSGTYDAPANGTWIFSKPQQLYVYGPADLNGVVYQSASSTAGAVRGRYEDLTVRGGFGCDAGLNTLTPVPTAELFAVTIELNVDLQTPLNVERCIVNISNSTIRARDPFIPALRIAGGGGSGGQITTIERSLLDFAAGGTNTPTPIRVEEFASIKISNSIIRDASTTNGLISFGTNVGTSSLGFSTVYNATLLCGDASTRLVSTNNIFLNETTGAPANTLTGTSCTHNYVMVKPQTTLAGSNNILNSDPRFANTVANDFHLLAGSPAIDAADPAATEPVDYEGTTRPQGARRDIGAFEYKP